MKSSVNKISLNIFMWALMPIILFSLVAVAIPYFLEKTDIQIASDKDTDWLTTILNNEIEMPKADSVSLPLGYGTLLQQGSVKHLFPDLECKDLAISHSRNEHRIFLILYTNSNVPIIVDSLYYKNGEWIGINMHNGKKVRLGKMIDIPNLNEGVVNASRIYINVYIAIMLLMLAICAIFEFKIIGDFRAIFVTIGCATIWGWLEYIFSDGDILSPYLIYIIEVLFCICEYLSVTTVIKCLYYESKIKNEDK